MNAATRLAAFGGVLTLALGAGALVGTAAGPVEVTEGADEHSSSDDAGVATPAVGGLSAVDQGYTFVPGATTLTPGTPFTFTIDGPDGEPVTDYEVDLDEELHLLVVGIDLDTYHHVHPERDAAGTWSVTLDDLGPGTYRAVANAVPEGGPDLALAANVTVPGAFTPAPLPDPAPVAVLSGVDDGYEVSLDGDLRPGSSRVRLTVELDGAPVDDLEPYLGALGHLVAFRVDDLAYAHVHPDDAGADGGATVPFTAELPSAGTYRLFFDFAHDGEVRTAAFTVVVPATGADAPSTGEPTHDEPTHDDEEGH